MTNTEIIDTLKQQAHCNSWIVVSRATGKPVLETYERKTAEAINLDRYEVMTALQWLVRFNRSIKGEVV